jgi:hypothetical protein
MSKTKKILIPFTVILLIPMVVNAVEYTSLSKATELGLEDGIPDFGTFLNTLFTWGISFAGIIAVIVIIFGGIQYMTTDAVSGKSEGKEKIKRAFTGLIIVLSSILVLNTINPRITTFNLGFENQTIRGTAFNFTIEQPTWTGTSSNGQYTFVEGNATTFGNEEINSDLLDIVRNSGLMDLNPRDAGRFFKGGQPTVEGWAQLLTTMAKLESDHNPSLTYTENFKDNNGDFVVSTGLLQLSQESVSGYGFTGITTEALKNPHTNLVAGAEVLRKLVSQDGVISSDSNDGGARYWAVLRGDKANEISNTVLK